MSHEERINAVLNKFGYVILCSAVPVPINYVTKVTSGKLGGVNPIPLIKISEGTREEAIEQEKYIAGLEKRKVKEICFHYFNKLVAAD